MEVRRGSHSQEESELGLGPPASGASAPDPRVVGPGCPGFGVWRLWCQPLGRRGPGIYPRGGMGGASQFLSLVPLGLVVLERDPEPGLGLTQEVLDFLNC